MKRLTGCWKMTLTRNSDKSGLWMQKVVRQPFLGLAVLPGQAVFQEMGMPYRAIFSQMGMSSLRWKGLSWKPREPCQLACIQRYWRAIGWVATNVDDSPRRSM